MTANRIKISAEDAVRYYNIATGRCFNNAREVYEDLGCGRSCRGLQRAWLKPEHERALDKMDAIDPDGYCVFVTDKERTPPVFRIGAF